MMLQVSHWLITVDTEYKNIYWNQCSGTQSPAACSRLHACKRTHTRSHTPLSQGLPALCVERSWNALTLCSADICIEMLSVKRMRVVFACMLCCVLWWTSWLQRAGVWKYFLWVLLWLWSEEAFSRTKRVFISASPTSCYGRCRRSRRSCAHFPRVCPCLCSGRTGHGSRWVQGRWWLSGWSPSSALHAQEEQTDELGGQVKDKHIYFSCRSGLAKSGQDFTLIIAKLLSPQNERKWQR